MESATFNTQLRIFLKSAGSSICQMLIEQVELIQFWENYFHLQIDTLVIQVIYLAILNNNNTNARFLYWTLDSTCSYMYKFPSR